MRKTRLVRLNGAQQELLLPVLEVTESAWERMKGLLGTQPLTAEQGLWIEPCNSVHTFFMGYPLDVVYVDRQRRVCHRVEALKPWRCSAAFKAAAVIEMQVGQIQRNNIQVGDQLQWQDG